MPNAYFQGLSFNTASEARAYLHFRKPESLQSQALLKRPGIIKSGDFMDCIDKDYPAGKNFCFVSIAINRSKMRT
jgi:hypothetical protein